jgi:cyclophilin family peptidyl-prolyl cis-trans isomerase
MPHKLKSTARKSRRNKKIGIVVGLAVLALIVGVGLFYVFGQPISQYGLLVDVGGSGSTNATGTRLYNDGTTVAVQASPGSGMILKEWLLNDTSVGSANPYVVTMSENRNLTAVFAEITVQGKVLLQTSMGNIIIELRDDKPITSGNFKSLVQQGLYDGTIFHRVIEGFMIQGGEVNASIGSIPDEIGSNNSNVKGTIAMAKTSQPNSATSGFFINVVNNGDNVIDEAGTKFDSVYTVFGTVIEGMDVAEAISHVQVDDPGGQSPKPLQDVTIIKAEILP